ncbi:hypothetical protein X274_09145 [Marinitoga sp. 1155]|nr:hypothetical protein X274_09145 [Marinitoga sp. 1155]
MVLNLEFLNNTIYDYIAGKIEPMLASDNVEDILFAFKILNNLKIDKINKTKLDAIKILIKDIDEKKFHENDKALIKKVKNKII